MPFSNICVDDTGRYPNQQMFIPGYWHGTDAPYDFGYDVYGSANTLVFSAPWYFPKGSSQITEVGINVAASATGTAVIMRLGLFTRTLTQYVLVQELGTINVMTTSVTTNTTGPISANINPLTQYTIGTVIQGTVVTTLPTITAEQNAYPGRPNTPSLVPLQAMRHSSARIDGITGPFTGPYTPTAVDRDYQPCLEFRLT